MRGKRASLLILEDDEILEHAPLAQTKQQQQQQQQTFPREGTTKKTYHYNLLERIVTSRFVSFFTSN